MSAPDFSPLALTTPELLSEVDALSLRAARRETTSRDVMLVHALAARVRSLNREPLEGMLYLGDIEPSDAAPTLSFTEFESRRAA